MDLSRAAKIRRDAIENPLWVLEKLLDDLEECHTRNQAAMDVWPETRSTLRPALDKQEIMLEGLKAFQEKFSELWHEGFESKWKEEL